MTEITCNGKTYKLYSSIKELPILLSKKMNAYLLQDISIGSSITDIDEHLARLMNFMQTDKKEEAIEEAKNLRYNMFSMLSAIDYKSLSYACLIESIDGIAIADHSEENLTKISENLTGEEFDLHFKQVKKNWIPNVN